MRRLNAAFLGLGLLASTGRASAWIFPEHAEITRFAYDHYLPQSARRALQEAVIIVSESTRRDVACDGCQVFTLPLCAEASIPLARFAGYTDACVPFTALPALAGDHATGEADFRTLLRGRSGAPAIVITHTVAVAFSEFLDDAPLEIARLYRGTPIDSTDVASPDADSMRRMFTRTLDLQLRAHDEKYVDRAGGSRAHFQDATTPLDILLLNTARGDLDNALAQTLAHHIRSMEYAARVRTTTDPATIVEYTSKALLENAFATHFLQDAFAAGHMGTEHAVGGGAPRLRRHDFLNRAGLTVTHALTTTSCKPRIGTSAIGIESKDKDNDCWVAYGDGYLDATNSDKAAEATARLQMQLALALKPGIADEIVQGCEPQTAPGRVLFETTSHLFARDIVDGAAGSPPKPPPPPPPCVVRADGPTIVSKCPVYLTKDSKVVVRVSSPDFDPYLQVRVKGKFRQDNSDENVLSSAASTEFVVPESGDYDLEVSPETARQEGTFTIKVTEAPVRAEWEPTKIRCAALYRSAKLLDPAPSWSISPAQSDERSGWNDETRRVVEEQTLAGALTAITALSTTEQIGEAPGSGVSSGSQPKSVPYGIIGYPLEPCRPSKPWAARTHPMCQSEGTEYRFGDPDASLWRPILAVWPMTVTDVRTIRGQESFGYGFATQAVYGAIATAAMKRTVPWGVAPWIGVGGSYRADGLFPDRDNRDLIGANFVIAPAFLANSPSARYSLLFFAELRAPLWAGLGSFFTGKPWSFGPMEVGPTGARMYWELPSKAPGGDNRYLGFDVEALNVKLHGSRAARTASVGNIMDWELHARVGSLNLSRLDPELSSKRAFTAGLEISGGYSVFAFAGDE